MKSVVPAFLLVLSGSCVQLHVVIELSVLTPFVVLLLQSDTTRPDSRFESV